MGAVPSRSLLSIGEVLAQLRPDFPDVTVSKIRFLESEGLVQPARTPSGYRKFSPADVARLHYVLAAQRDHYLPLRVIKEHLQARDGGQPAPGPRALGQPGEVRLTREALLAAAKVDAALLEQMQEHGLVAAVRAGRAAEETFDADALAVASVVAELAAYGLAPRHLRSLRTAVDREADLVGQVIGPLLRQRSPQARARAEEAARELGALLLRAHTALARTRIRDLTGP